MSRKHAHAEAPQAEAPAHETPAETPQADAPAQQPQADAPAEAQAEAPAWDEGLILTCHEQSIAFADLPATSKRRLVTYGFSKSLQDAASGDPKRAESLAARFDESVGLLARAPGQDDAGLEKDQKLFGEYVTDAESVGWNISQGFADFPAAVAKAAHLARLADIISGAWAEGKTRGGGSSPRVSTRSEFDRELAQVVLADLTARMTRQAKAKGVKGFKMPGVTSDEYKRAVERLMSVHGDKLRAEAQASLDRRKAKEAEMAQDDLDLTDLDLAAD